MKYLSLLLGILFVLCLACDKPAEHYWGKDVNRFWSRGKMSYYYLNRIASDESHVVWSTGNHTAMPVPVGSVGPKKYTDKFKGMIQNTDFSKYLKEAVRENINVILVIGDGMGCVHMSLPILKNTALGNGEKTYFEKIMKEGSAGYCLTNLYDGLVTGSGAAATAIATGSKTYLKEIGMDHEGYPTVSVLDVAESLGYVSGLITDSKITDATPAGFFGNVINRSMECEIARQLVQDNEIEVFMGGGADFFIPQGETIKETEWFKDWPDCENDSSAREDEKDLIKEAQEKGYVFVKNRDELLSKGMKAEKLAGLFARGGLLARIDRDDEETYQPSITDMSKVGLEVLDRRDENYFMMIECGRIDWESHSNDLGAVALAVEEMDSVLLTAYEYYQKDPENTLLVFTADHETGGLGFAYFGLGKKIKEELKSGKVRVTSSDNFSFENYLRIFEQKKSVGSIFAMSESADELYENLKKYYPFEVSKEEAKVLYDIDQGYTGK